jgi:secreted PhoX family phosphatase
MGVMSDPRSPAPLSRRALLAHALTGVLVSGCASRPEAPPARHPTKKVRAELGPLEPGPVLDLPRGFRAVVVQAAGKDTLDDGRPVPGFLDGMACFQGDHGEWVLLRNHEIGPAHPGPPRPKVLTPRDGDTLVDPAMRGGVSRVRVDPSALRRSLAGDTSARPVLGSTMALFGTDTNCSGGVVAGGWVSCEESDRPGHGYAFHVPATEGARTRKLPSWGRFKREAVALAADGAVYMTEDHEQGLLYRFLPEDRARPLDEGVLEALVVRDLRSTAKLTPGSALRKAEGVTVEWVRVPDPLAESRPCREQCPEATTFSRLEGIVWDGSSLWLAATQGGHLERGQVFRLVPGRGKLAAHLALAYEVEDPRVLSQPDNLGLAPWGDVLLCEDNYTSSPMVTHQHLRLRRPDGTLLDLARNPKNTPERPGEAPGDELTGACFSPDGSVLFVNLQGDRDETVAITGPWPKA